MNIKHHLQTVGIALIISAVTFSLGDLSLTQKVKHLQKNLNSMKRRAI
ncbi:exported hypothetical protein [Vibrio coralliirubri]|uniref:Uncharacterized protein n=1 Tax=Vibrio coralliirubri TaxID=1516159 RepID=A0AA86XRP9_9VIBR|nr:exported hypothetical protein [Vibrio coralliirubri]CDT71011.1 exported hypothetical protein [Vibrio coralliirubri]